MRLAILLLARHPRFDIILFHLPQSEIGPAVDDDAIGQLQFLQKLFRVLGNLLVQAHGFLVPGLAQNYLLELLELVYAEDALGVFAVASRLAPKTRRKREEFDR